MPEICDPSCLKLMSKTLPLTKKRSTGVWRVQSCKGSSKPTTQVRSTSPKKPCPPRISICSIPILVQCKFAKRAIFHTMVQQNWCQAVAWQHGTSVFAVFFFEFHLLQLHKHNNINIYYLHFAVHSCKTHVTIASKNLLSAMQWNPLKGSTNKNQTVHIYIYIHNIYITNILANSSQVDPNLGHKWFTCMLTQACEIRSARCWQRHGW